MRTTQQGLRIAVLGLVVFSAGCLRIGFEDRPGGSSDAAVSVDGGLSDAADAADGGLSDAAEAADGALADGGLPDAISSPPSDPVDAAVAADGGVLETDSGTEPIQTWEAVDPPPNDVSFEAIDLDLAVDENDRVFVTWSDDSGGSLNVYLKYWTGQSWEALGGSGTADGISQTRTRSYSCGVELDQTGWPHVLWMERDWFENYVGTFYRYWDGSAWASLAGAGVDGRIDSESSAFWPTFKFDALGQPLVSMESLRANWNTLVGHWTGSVLAGFAGSMDDGGISGPGNVALTSLALGLDGAIHVVWQESVQPENYLAIRHRYFDGTVWRSVSGEISTPGRNTERATVALDSLSRPVVSWTYTDTHEVYVVRSDGAGWVELASSPGSPASSGAENAANSHVFITPGDRLFLFFDADTPTGHSVYAREWVQEARWDAVGGGDASGLIDPTSSNGGWPVVAGSSTALYVMWEERAGGPGSAIHLFRFPL